MLGLALALPVAGEVLPVGETLVVTTRERALGVKAGQTLWARTVPEGQLVGNPPLLLTKDAVLSLDPATGNEDWRVDLKEPWLAPRLEGDLILYGDGPKLIALKPQDGQVAWELPVSGKATVEAGPDGKLAVLAAEEMQVLQNGRLLWKKPVIKKEGTVGPWWSPAGDQVALRNGLVWVVLDAATGSLARPVEVDWLDRHADEPGDYTRLELPDTGDRLYGESKSGFGTRRLGELGKWQPLPGKPLAQIGTLLLLSSGMPMPDMAMDENGQVIVDLKTGMPKANPVDGYVALRLPDMRPLEGSPRGALVGTRQLVGDWALFTTQEAPSQAPGQRKPPAPDPVLHGRNGDQVWTYQGPFRPDWTVVNGQVLLAEADHLKALDPKTGQVVWTSPSLVMGDGSPTIVAEPETLLVQTAADRLYALTPTGQLKWTADLREGFILSRLNHLIAFGVLSAAIAYFILAARKRELFIRPIAGLKAVDNAVGRATEMGKPILFVPGLEDVDEIQTLASLSILRHVARRAAEYDSSILVPTRRAVVMSTAQEVVKEAYTAAGRPDGYHAENIRYLTDDQFGFVVGVDGIMLRERPAANFYLGMFYAESLILAETGHATGAIQIAGTAAPSQLPFFVAACDYTLIGEELYAASAYLSQDPLQIGSLRGQDVGKAIVMLAILVGAFMVTFGHDALKVWFQT